MEKWNQGEHAQLQVRFDEEYFSDYFLTDEAFLRLTFDDIEDDVTITGDGNQTEAVDRSGTIVELQIHDDKSGSKTLLFNLYMTYPNNPNSLSLSSIEFCTGSSPTAGTPTHDPSDVTSDAFCEELLRGPNNGQTGLYVSNSWTCRGCMTLKADTQVTEIITSGDFVEVEFSGDILFGAYQYPVKEAVNVMDNVWRIFFDDWTVFDNNMDWELQLTYIGSQAKELDITV